MFLHRPSNQADTARVASFALRRIPLLESLLIGGLVAAVVSAFLGELAQGVVLLSACVAAFVLLLRSLRKFPATERAPWIALACAVGSWLTSLVVTAVFPSFATASGNAPALTEYIDFCAYVCAIGAAWLFGRQRTHDQDPTNWLDATVLTLGVAVFSWVVVAVPNLTSPDVLLGRQIVNCAFALFDLVLFAAVARLAVGPGARNGSYYLLFAFNVCVLLSDALVSLEQAHIRFGGQDQLLLSIATIGFFSCAASAVSTDAREITRPMTAPIGRMAVGRFVLMSSTVLVSPVLLVTHPHPDNIVDVGLGVLWVLTTGLVMARFSGLVRARENESRMEQIVSRAAGSLATATAKEEQFDSSLGAVLALCGNRTVRASVLLVDDRVWSVGASRGVDAELLINASHDALERTLGSAIGAAAAIETSLFGGEFADRTLAIPLIAQGRLRGVLTVETLGALPSAVVAQVKRLATDLTLAVEASALAQDLHKRQSEQRFRSLVQQSHDLVAVVDPKGRITYVSPSSEVVLGMSEASLMGRQFTDLLANEDRQALRAAVSLLSPEDRSPLRIEVRCHTAGGSLKTMDMTVTDLRSEPTIGGFIINAHDVTERKQLEESLRHKILHDDLTGISNRVLLRERIQHALAGRARNRRSAAVLFIDLDDFKTVNDGLGHTAGDELLQVIAFRLDQYVRDGDTAARLGGDEFAVLLEDVQVAADALVIAERLLEIIEEPVVFNGRQLAITASVGIAMAEADSTPDVLLRNADVAMYHAKHGGKGRVSVFDESMYVSAFERLELKADLAKALENDELKLHYQPIFAFNGDLLGFEALMRWIHPVRGFVSPGAFIPLAEEMGLIVPIGEWALQEALAQLALWQQELPGHNLTMNVNVSPRQLQDAGIVDAVAAALRISGVAPASVILELTESADVDESTSTDRLARLRELGVGLAADDFGSGFASYAALAQLPFTVVKLDRSLITNLTGAFGNAHAQVKSIIDMAHATGLQVVAEGIEETSQRDALAAMGCDKAQGFLLGKPASVENTDDFIRVIRLESSIVA